MHFRLLDFLADPHDGGELTLHAFQTHGDQTRDGVLVNAKTGRWYVVQDGIPSLFIDALRPDDRVFASLYRDRLCSLGLDLPAVGSMLAGPALDETMVATDRARIESERRARDEQAEAYDRMISLALLSWFEAPAYRAALVSENENSTLLEAGCGTGRFTQLFAQIAPQVVALDMSRDSLLRNRARHVARTYNPVFYVHADVTNLPLRDGCFGRCAHVGVYEHIPSHELRLRFLRHARRALRPGGSLLLSAYRYGGLTRFFEKEGEHAGGIPFLRFTADELKEEVSSAFEIVRFRANLGIYMSMVMGRSPL